MTPEEKAFELLIFYQQVCAIRNNKMNAQRSVIKLCLEMIDTLKLYDKPVTYWKRVIEEVEKL